jgi:hypothetical protein
MVQSSSLKDIALFLEAHDQDERHSRAKWHLEIANMGIASPESDDRAGWEAFEVDHALRSEIDRCWLETGWAYSYGLFQSAVLLASIVVELSIERYLRRKELWDEYADKTPENHRTLGSLTAFCRAEKRRGAYLTSTILSLCKRLNALRIEAAHMNNHRYMNTFPPEDLSPPNEMDEVEDVSVRTVNEKGEITIAVPATTGEPVFIDPRGVIVKIRAFKQYAREAIGIASQTANLVSQLY